MFSINNKPRYFFLKVVALTFVASACSTAVVYVQRIAVGVPFNWIAYREYLLNQVVGAIATAILFYFALNKFHNLFQQKKSIEQFISPILFCIISVEVYNVIVDRLLPLTSNINNPLPLISQLVGHLLVAITFTIAAILIAYINHLRDVRKKHKLLEKQKLQLEVEKAHAELKFLKSQINPHFLHNTLNSFYSRSLPLSQELADGILTLSEIMRYALDEANTYDGKVFLQDEIEHVRNLVKLHQFRFRNNLQINLLVTGALNGTVIIPFVLITLVENIFKHADLTNDEYPIVISIEVDGHSLRYHSSNKKKIGPKELSTGIGLDNIKRRLDIAYGTHYSLNITEEAEVYITELSIHNL